MVYTQPRVAATCSNSRGPRFRLRHGRRHFRALSSQWPTVHAGEAAGRIHCTWEPATPPADPLLPIRWNSLRTPPSWSCSTGELLPRRRFRLTPALFEHRRRTSHGWRQDAAAIQDARLPSAIRSLEARDHASHREPPRLPGHRTALINSSVIATLCGASTTVSRAAIVIIRSRRLRIKYIKARACDAPSHSASVNACWSTIAPRAVLMRKAVGFIIASPAALTRPRVAVESAGS